MNNDCRFLTRLYVFCLLAVALPLLPPSDCLPAVMSSKSNTNVSPLSDAELDDDLDETPADGYLRLLRARPAISPPNIGQSGALRVVIGASSDAKRQRFTPWGGKRTYDSGASIWKRPKFQPWGGKRFARRAIAPRYANNRMSAYVDDNRKREFHPWGGKRSI